MGLFALQTLRQPPSEFLDNLDKSFFSIPRSWESQIGEETIELLEALRSGDFIGVRRWKDMKWRRSSLPRMSWSSLATLFNLCAQYVLELETYDYHFRKDKARFTIKQFMIQDWRDPQNPWSLFLACCFGTSKDGSRVIQRGEKIAHFLGSLTHKPVSVADMSDEVVDTIYGE